MAYRTLIATLAAASLVALPGIAAAQDTGDGTQNYTEIEDDTVMVRELGLSVEQLDDMDVMGADGEQIGEVEDVLADGTGQPAALVVETEGFIGIGDEDVVVELGQFQQGEDQLMLNMTEEELEALPKWDD